MIFPALLFLVAISSVISASFIMFAMIGEINRKSPESEQISYVWGHPAKYKLIYSEYRRLHPDGRLLFYYRLILYSGFGLLAVFALAWRIGIFK